MRTIHGKLVPDTLAEILIPETTAHIVVDLQNDCCHPDGSLARAGSDVSRYPETLGVVARLVAETRACGVLQVFVRLVTLPNGASDSPAWLRLRTRMAGQYSGKAGIDAGPLPYCLEGSWGAEFIEPIEVSNEDVVVSKHRSSAFFGTDLDMILRSAGIKSLIFTGCTTEGCVESSVRDAGFLDYFTVVARDGVQSDVPELHEASLRVMEAYRADVANADEIVQALKAR